MPRRVQPTLLLAITIFAGLTLRFGPLAHSLPYVVWKYGGSMLWAAAVYWLLASLAPKARTLTALTASAISLAVEFSRLINWPPLNHFRPTLPGRLLLGAIFSPKNIVAYLLAIALTALLDHRLRT